ncbi:unnamed protein product [Pleuronectes platessa]|uniref:Uncharacterized protein n=1 Tax=Pleuronectes platessa TaxID=8262 RepID=A0A9N7UX87_PLEPL|nr:unnamed protein product [Pleuronectes platessa]
MEPVAKAELNYKVRLHEPCNECNAGLRSLQLVLFLKKEVPQKDIIKHGRCQWRWQWKCAKDAFVRIFSSGVSKCERRMKKKRRRRLSVIPRICGRVPPKNSRSQAVLSHPETGLPLLIQSIMVRSEKGGRRETVQATVEEPAAGIQMMMMMVVVKTEMMMLMNCVCDGEERFNIVPHEKKENRVLAHGAFKVIFCRHGPIFYGNATMK